MSTNLKSNISEINLTRFWGGDKRGVCIQISTPNRLKNRFDPESIQLSKSDACSLARDLFDFSTNRAKEEV